MDRESSIVNFKLLPIKLHYFLFVAGVAGMEIFQPTIIKQVGLTTSSMAVIYFAMPLISLLSRIASGVIADKFHVFRAIFLSSLCASALVIFVYVFIPQRAFAKATFLCTDTKTMVVLPRHAINGDAGRENKNVSCEIITNFNDKFYGMCDEWQTSSQNYSVVSRSAQFHCNRLETNIEFVGNENSSTIEGKIMDVQSAEINTDKITIPHCAINNSVTSFVNCQTAGKIDSFAQEITSPAFWFVFTGYIVFSMAFGVVLTFTDTMCYQLLENKPYEYGRQRIFGSIGFALAAMITGLLIEYYSDRTTDSVGKNYLPLYLFSLTMLSLDTLLSFKLKITQNKNSKFEFEKLTKLGRNFDVVLFTFWCLVCGIMQQVQWSYLFWYIEEISGRDTSKYVKILQASHVLIHSLIGESILFFNFGNIAKKIGLGNCMTIVLLLNVMRFSCYVMMKSIIWIIPIACIDGIIYAATYILITTCSKKISQPGTETTVQAIFMSIFNGIGTSVGGLCGGIMYTWLGGVTMFKIFGLSSFVACILHLFLRCTISKRLTTPTAHISYELREKE